MEEGRKDSDISFGPDFMSDEIPIFQKHVEADDSDWKDKLKKESVQIDEKVNAERSQKQNNETNQGLVKLVSVLASQAYMLLGAVENPATGTRTMNVEQAKESIDMLTALVEKTKGNVSEEEDKLLKQVISELQMIYVEAVRGPTSPPPAAPPSGDAPA